MKPYIFACSLMIMASIFAMLCAIEAPPIGFAFSISVVSHLLLIMGYGSAVYLAIVPWDVFSVTFISYCLIAVLSGHADEIAPQAVLAMLLICSLEYFIHMNCRTFATKKLLQS